MKTEPKTDTDCRKCGAPMPANTGAAVWMGRPVVMNVTAYRCKSCDHWNDLKRRKPRARKEPSK